MNNHSQITKPARAMENMKIFSIDFRQRCAAIIRNALRLRGEAQQERSHPQYEDAETQTHDEIQDALANDGNADNATEGSSTNSSSSDDGWADRRDQEAIRDIEDIAFRQLVLHHLDQGNSLDLCSCRIERRAEGTFNHCAILSVEGHGRFAIKVPFTGTEKLWQEGDAHNLRSEAQTMAYIRQHTKVPVPEVLAFDDTLENEISAPYILMRAVDGKPAQRLWTPANADGTPNYVTNDAPSPEQYELRCNFLKSLAYTMAELRNLDFDKIGMLNFDSGDKDAPQAGHYYVDANETTLKRVDAHSSSKSYLKAALTRAEEATVEMNEILYGVSAIFNIIYNTPPFKNGTTKETFVLAHPDFDFQNIYVDDDGNVTGLIDWDMTLTVPRCIGYASLPLFLRKDWDPDYEFKFQHPPWILDHYRGVYSKYMLEALSATEPDGGDAKYTPKSALYHAVFCAFGQDSKNAPALVDMLFKVLPGLRAMDKEDFLEKLGSDEGWSAAESMLISELGKLLSA